MAHGAGQSLILPLTPLRFGGSSANGDRFWDRVKLLAFNETGKANGNTNFADQSLSARTLSIEIGTPQWTTAQFVNAAMGASVTFDGTDDAITAASHADFAFGTADFTVEGYIRQASFAGNPDIFGTKNSDPQIAPVIYTGTDGIIRLFVNGADAMTGTTATSTNTWYHWALCRGSGTSRLFLNGVQEGSNFSDSNNYVQGKFWIGLDFDNSNDYNGQMSNLRVTLAARYLNNFTKPTPPFPRRK